MTRFDHGPDQTSPEDSSGLQHVEDLLKLEAEAEHVPPPRVPGYEILEELGRGGMGLVFRARQVCLGREVALKVIVSGGLANSEQRRRFRREAEVAARLQHPNVVLVVEVGEHNGCLFYAMEWLRGGSLDRRLDGRPWPAAGAVTLVRTLAEAVHYAHQQGIIHRDLKPSNVLMAADGSPKVGDFGLALIPEPGTGLTRSGAVLGTPAYMAPEQAAGHPHQATAATDVYALGVILYQLLTGRPPFQGPTPLLLQQVVHQEPPPPARLVPAVPRDLETICLKCLEKEPARRYTSAAELAEDLGRFQEGQPLRARPVGLTVRCWRRIRRRPLAAGLALVLLLLLPGGMGGFLLLRYQAELDRQEANRVGELASKHAQEAESERLLAESFLRYRVSHLYETTGHHPSLFASGGRIPPPSPDRLALANTLSDQAQHLLPDLDLALARGNPEVPYLRLRLAVIFQRVARFYRAERKPQESQAALEQACKLLEDRAGKGAEDGRVRWARAKASFYLGWEFQNREQVDRAIPMLEEGSALFRQLLEESPGNDSLNSPPTTKLDMRQNWFNCCRLLSRCLESVGQPGSEARRQALRISSDLLEGRLAPTLTTEQRASLRVSQGNLHRLEGARSLAIHDFEQAAQLYGSLREARPDDVGIRLHLGLVYHYLGRQHRDAGRWDAALAAYSFALPIRQRLHDDDPAHLGFLNDLAFTWHDLSQAQEKRGQFREALAAAERALALHQELLAKEPDAKLNQRRVDDRLREVAHLHQLLAQAPAPIP